MYTWQGGGLVQYIFHTNGHGKDVISRICYTHVTKVRGSEWDMPTHEVMCQETTCNSPRFPVFQSMRGSSEYVSIEPQLFWTVYRMGFTIWSILECNEWYDSGTLWTDREDTFAKQSAGLQAQVIFMTTNTLMSESVYMAGGWACAIYLSYEWTWKRCHI